MKKKDIEKNMELIEDITKLDKIRQIELVEDIDEILKELEGD